MSTITIKSIEVLIKDLRNELRRLKRKSKKNVYEIDVIRDEIQYWKRQIENLQELEVEEEGYGLYVPQYIVPEVL